MRAIIEISEQQLERMKPVLELEGISRAELIQRAVNKYLKQYLKTDESSAFGLWSDRSKGELKYQDELRCEWDL